MPACNYNNYRATNHILVVGLLLTTCEHSGSSSSAQTPPFSSRTSTMCWCSSAGKPKKQIFWPSNAFKRCAFVKSSWVASNSSEFRADQAAYTQAGRTTVKRNVLAYLLVQEEKNLLMKTIHISFCWNTYWYFSPPLWLHMRCVVFVFRSFLMQPPIECMRFTSFV